MERSPRRPIQVGPFPFSGPFRFNQSDGAHVYRSSKSEEIEERKPTKSQSGSQDRGRGWQKKGVSGRKGAGRWPRPARSPGWSLAKEPAIPPALGSLQFTRPLQVPEIRGFFWYSRHYRNDLYDPFKWSNCNSAEDVLKLEMSHPMNTLTSVTIVDGDGIIEAEV